MIEIFIMKHFCRLMCDGTLNLCYNWLIGINELSFKGRDPEIFQELHNAR